MRFLNPDQSGEPALPPAVDAPRGAVGARPLLPESHGTVRVPENAPAWRKFLAYFGPGLLIAVGYMDPGNWATDLAGGAQFGYLLLSVVLISNCFAILLQHLALKLGIVTGRDLAQMCREHSSKPWTITQWLLAEVAIAACDLAEVIGSAVALNLLFGLPIFIGVIITSLDVLVVLALQHRGFRYIEALVGALIFVIAACFAYELAASHPQWIGAVAGLLPRPEIVTNPAALYLAIGILGATVMPHNLYLHSSIVQTRNFRRDDNGKASAICFATWDSSGSLFAAFFVNAAILILSAATFHGTGHEDVADISVAYKLLSPMLGASLASVLFAIALLASGQNSTLTGTLAGQIVMEGYLNLRLPQWVRRLVTRLVAVVPAAIVAAIAGERGINELLIFSQVILSFQLSFAVFPLVAYTGRRRLMGRFTNPRWLQIVAWAVAVLILMLNVYLVIATVRDMVAT
jgi:manganese transport protein